MSSEIRTTYQEYQSTSLILDELLSSTNQNKEEQRELIATVFKQVTEFQQKTKDLANKELASLSISSSDPESTIMTLSGITHDVETSYKRLQSKIQDFAKQNIPAFHSSIPSAFKEHQAAQEQTIPELCSDIKHRIDTLSFHLRSMGTDIDFQAIERNFQDTLALFEKAVNKIQEAMTKCSYGDDILAGKEDEFLFLTSQLDEMKCDFKNLCHAVRTYHPTFSFPTKDLVAQMPRLLLDEQPSERANIQRYSQNNGIDLSSYLCRPILGDGNCFYHSIATAIIAEGRLDSFISIIPEDLHIPFALKDQLKAFFHQAKLNSEEAIRDTNGMMKFVWMLKEITARELFIHAADYSEDELRMYLSDEFPHEESTILSMRKEALIQSYVREMGKEACAITIGAFSRATKLPIIIHNPSRVDTPMRMMPDEATSNPIHIFRAGLHFFLLQSPEASQVQPYRELSTQTVKLIALSNSPGRLYVRGSKGFVDVEMKDNSSMTREALNWDRGIPLKQISSHTWQIQLSLGSEFKLLIDDKTWSDGENMIASAETATKPVFPLFTSSSSILVDYKVGFGDRLIICGEGTVTFEGATRKLSWNPEEGLPLACLEPSKWAAQFAVAQSGHFKIVMLQANGTAKWEKGENRPLKDLVESFITPQFQA
jgi:hypothetical protein